MKAGTRGQVSEFIVLSPADLYNLVSNVQRMGEWSPECRKCEWLDGATGPTVGARFKGTNRRGIASWSTISRVVAADPGNEFAFATGHRGRDMTVWAYRFAAIDGGTEVTETFEVLVDTPWYFRFADRFLIGAKDRRVDLERGMAETLLRIKAAAGNQATPATTGTR